MVDHGGIDAVIGVMQHQLDHWPQDCWLDMVTFTWYMVPCCCILLAELAASNGDLIKPHHLPSIYRTMRTWPRKRTIQVECCYIIYRCVTNTVVQQQECLEIGGRLVETVFQNHNNIPPFCTDVLTEIRKQLEHPSRMA